MDLCVLMTVKKKSLKNTGPQRLAAAKSPDASIDRLVYDLYGLTAAEIAIVEGSGG
jgi:hypothetical protein